MQLMVGKVSLPNGTGAPRMSGGIHLFRTPPRHLEAGSTSEFLNLIVKPQRHSPVNHPRGVVRGCGWAARLFASDRASASALCDLAFAAFAQAHDRDRLKAGETLKFSPTGCDACDAGDASAYITLRTITLRTSLS